MAGKAGFHRKNLAPSTTDVGRTLRELRLAHGWNQREFAEVAGVPSTLISNIESGGIKNPGVYTLWPLAVTLGVSLEQLMGVEGGTTRVRQARLRRESRERRVGSIVKAVELARAPILYVHEDEDAEPVAVLVKAGVWSDIIAEYIVPAQGDVMPDKLMDHDHLHP